MFKHSKYNHPRYILNPTYKELNNMHVSLVRDAISTSGVVIPQGTTGVLKNMSVGMVMITDQEPSSIIRFETKAKIAQHTIRIK